MGKQVRGKKTTQKETEIEQVTTHRRKRPRSEERNWETRGNYTTKKETKKKESNHTLKKLKTGEGKLELSTNLEKVRIE